MTISPKATNLITTAYIFLSFYVLGGLVIENDVNYSTWYFINANGFGLYHRALESRLGIFLFFPMTMHLLVTTLLLWFRPASISRGIVISLLILTVYIIAESLLVQVPVHKQLEKQPSAELIDKLIFTHRWYRLPAEILVTLLNLYVLSKVLRPATS